MARLPQPGGDNGNWGTILNDFLAQALKPSGQIKDNAVTSNTIAPNSVTNAAIATDAVNATSIADGSITNSLIADSTIQESKLSSGVQTKLNANSGTPDWNTIINKPAVIAAGADQASARAAIGAGVSNLVLGTTGTTAKAGDYTPTKGEVGLGNADNTSDANKPVSAATHTALDAKVDKNTAISGATKTKVTYDAKGLVTGGADATTADIADSTDRRYVTDAQKTIISNTSGTNTGDQDLSGFVPSSRTVNGHVLSADISVTKADVGLADVDNTSDTTKNSAAVTLTNKTIDGSNNTLQNIPESAVTNLVTDLVSRQSQADWALRRIGNTVMPSRRTNFATWANTSSPSTTEDTGQTAAHTGLLTSGTPIISNGKWTIAPTPGTGNFYTYRYFQESSNITRIGMRFSFDDLGGTRTTNKGTVVMVISTEAPDLASPNVNNFKFGCHLYIGPTDWGAYTYRYDTNTFHQLAYSTFPVPLAEDGTIYESEIYRVGNTLTMVLPDGTVRTVTDPEVGSWSTNWGWVEAAVDYHDTDNIPGIIEYWVDTKPQRLPLTEGTAQAGFARNTPFTTLKDSTFTIQDDGDATKQAKFQASTISSGATRTYSLPDADTTLVGTGTTQTLTNKTLTSPTLTTPRITNTGYIADNNGNKQIVFSTTTSAVNQIQIANAAIGTSPQIKSTGTDTNVNLVFGGKGTGKITFLDGTDATKQVQFDTSSITSGSTRILALPDASTTLVGRSTADTLTNKTLDNTNVVTLKGGNITIQDATDTTKQVQLVPSTNIPTATTRTVTLPNGNVTLIGTTTTDTLTNKTLTDAKINSIKDTNGVTSIDIPATASAVNYIGVRNKATGGSPSIEAQGTDTNIGLLLAPKGNGTVKVYVATGQTPTVQADGADANHSLNLLSKGTGTVQVNGASIVTASSTDTLTNKTLTAPKISGINDTNGAGMFYLTPTASAVDYLGVTNAAAGGIPVLGAAGTDTNISFQLQPKGNGKVYIYQPTTATPVTLEARGADTNHDFNINAKGTGTVQANGVPVVTASAAQTLTNKTLDNTNTYTARTDRLTLQDSTDTTKQVTFDVSGGASSSTRLLGLPSLSTTLVGRSSTDTLTNKTLTAPVINTGINAQTGTTYTLVLSDGGQLVTLSNAAAITLTMPLNSSVAYAVGTRIDLAQLGAGQVTIAATGGVTINATPGLKLSTQYSGATLTKLATDTWLLVGDLSA